MIFCTPQDLEPEENQGQGIGLRQGWLALPRSASEEISSIRTEQARAPREGLGETWMKMSNIMDNSSEIEGLIDLYENLIAAGVGGE